MRADLWFRGIKEKKIIDRIRRLTLNKKFNLSIP